MVFIDQASKSAKPVEVAMKTNVSSKSVGKFQELVSGSDAVTVQSSHRQDSDAEWYIGDTDWKT